MRNRFIPHVEGLRGAAALSVLLGHLYFLMWGYAPFRDLADHISVLEFGWIGVSAFIVISGYCLALPIVDGKPFDSLAFANRRIRRILPAYLVALVFSVPFLYYGASVSGWWPSSDYVIQRLLVHLLMAQDLVPVPPIRDLDGPMWSVALEMQIYAVFALAMVPIWKRRSGVSVLLFALVLTLALIFLWPAFPRPWFLILFAFGILAAEHRAPPWLGWALGVAAVAQLAHDGQTLARADLLVGGATAAFLASKPGIVTRLLSTAPMVAATLAPAPVVHDVDLPVHAVGPGSRHLTSSSSAQPSIHSVVHVG